MTQPTDHDDTAAAKSAFSIASYGDADATQDREPLFAYLDGFAQDFAPMIDRGLDLLRLQPHSVVLDVGCGHGATMPKLAERIGGGGRVVGVDSSSTMIAEAQRRFDPASWPIEFHCADAASLPFDDSVFDAVRCDRVLMFVGDPMRALAEMRRVTRTGGRVVVTEGDLGTHAIDASDAAATRAVLEAVAARMPNSWSGRRLRPLFAACGLRDIDVCLFPYFSTRYDEWNGRLALDTAAADAVGGKRLDAAQAQRWLRELKERDAGGRFFACGTFVTVAGSR